MIPRMSIRLLSTPDDLARYDAWVRMHPEGSLWQSLAWKQYQEALGRDVRVYVDEAGERILASAAVVIDRTAWNLSTWEVPRGPLWSAAASSGPEEILDQITQDARKDRCITLYCSPLQALETYGKKFEVSHRHIQPTATRIIDLTVSEEEILAQMKPKGRYNIGVAERHGVRVEASTDVTAFHALMVKTAMRDTFRPLPLEIYRTFLHQVTGAFLLLAHHPETAEAVAGIIGVQWPADTAAPSLRAPTGIYYYGASQYEHRALMAPYLLQWHAMRRCKAAGCASYDLLGVAPPDADREHPWQGVSTFKEKFGGGVVVYPAEVRLTLKPITQRLLALKRRFG